MFGLGLSLTKSRGLGTSFPVFNPADYGALAAGYDASQESYGDGDPATMTDVLGAHDATGAGAARPTFAAESTSALAAYEFDGVANALSAAFTMGGTGVTVVAVIKAPWGASAYRPVLSSADFSSTVGAAVYLDVGGSSQDWVTGDSLVLGFGYTSTFAPRFVAAAGTRTGWEIMSWRMSGIRESGKTLTARNSLPGPKTAKSSWSVGLSSGTYGEAEINKLYLYDEELSDATLDALEGALVTQLALVRLVGDGNSLTYGTNLPDRPTQSWPAQLQTSVGEKWAVINKGLDSQTLDQMSAAVAANITPHYRPSFGARNILVVWETRNQMALAGSSAATAYSKLSTYCQARQSDGWTVIVLDVLPSDGAGLSAADRATVNGLIAAGWTGFADAFVSVGTDPLIGPDNENNSLTYYLSDHVHLNAAGYAIVAAKIKTAVEGLLA